MSRLALLIVDDEGALRDTLARYLSAKGYETRGVGTAAEALAIYRQWHPTLVLLDPKLPDQSGLEVLRQVRAMDPQGCVVVITALADLNLRQEALAAGAIAFAFKPLEVTALDRVLRSAAGVPAPIPERPTVLIVDDEPEIRVSLKSYLTGRGMNVFVAPTAEDALALLRSARPTPQAVLVDLELPRLSGKEFLKLVRRSHPELPLVILTAFGSLSRREEAEQLGITRFLQKPVPLETVETTLRETLQGGGT